MIQMQRRDIPISAHIRFDISRLDSDRISIDRPTLICRTPIVTGRSPPRVIYNPACTSIFLDSPLISSKHAELFFEGNSWYLRDLSSMNGTLVNGRRVDSEGRPVSDGDLLSFADIPAFFESTKQALNTALLLGNPAADLKGVENDIESVRRVLNLRKQFEGRIRTASGPAATRERVKAEMMFLSQFARPDSLSIFYYSGHGGPNGLGLSDGLLSPRDLSSHLDYFQGKKLVLLDCCYASIFLQDPPHDTLLLTGESQGKKLYEGRVSVFFNLGEVKIQGYLTRAFVKMLEENPLQLDLKGISESIERYYNEKVRGVRIFAVGSAIRLRSALGMEKIVKG